MTSITPTPDLHARRSQPSDPGRLAGESFGEPGPQAGKAATQHRILTAAMALFADRGYERASISQIAARSGVSRAAIFWHFGNKATLFQETCRHFLVPFHASLDRDLEHLDPRTRIVEQLTAYERFISANRATLHAFVGWVFSASPEQARFLRDELISLHVAFEASLERALVEWIGDPGEARHQATTLVAYLHGNMLLDLGSAAGRETRTRTLLWLLDRALGPAGARRR